MSTLQDFLILGLYVCLCKHWQAYYGCLQSLTALYGIAYMLYTSNLHENAQRVSIYIHQSV